MAWLRRVGQWLERRADLRLERNWLAHIRDNPAEENASFKRLVTTEDDPGWLDYFLARCESPAEQAFLRGIVPYFGLKPKHGRLLGEKLRIEMQVSIDCYRVDFLVDGSLVVEIDGAAYHNTPEARVRDEARDRVLARQNFATLRIPAKLVLNSPYAACEAVNTNWVKGRPKPPPPAWLSAVHSPGDAVEGGINLVGRLHRKLNRVTSVRQAIAPLEAAVQEEAFAVEAALRKARLDLEIAAYIGDDLEKRSRWNKIDDDLNALFVTDGASKFLITQRVSEVELDTSGLEDEVTLAQIEAERIALLERWRANWSGYSKAIESDRSLAHFANKALAEMGATSFPDFA